MSAQSRNSIPLLLALTLATLLTGCLEGGVDSEEEEIDEPEASALLRVDKATGIELAEPEEEEEERFRAFVKFDGTAGAPHETEDSNPSDPDPQPWRPGRER